MEWDQITDYLLNGCIMTARMRTIALKVDELINVIYIRDRTYKCFAFTRLSRPRVVPLETGMGPESWLSLRSNHERLVNLPMDGGMGPIKLLLLRPLKQMK